MKFYGAVERGAGCGKEVGRIDSSRGRLGTEVQEEEGERSKKNVRDPKKEPKKLGS